MGVISPISDNGRLICGGKTGPKFSDANDLAEIRMTSPQKFPKRVPYTGAVG